MDGFERTPATARESAMYDHDRGASFEPLTPNPQPTVPPAADRSADTTLTTTFSAPSPAPGPRRRSRSGGTAAILGAALLSAILAAGGTAALVAGPLRTVQATPGTSAGAPVGVTTATGANPSPGATTDLPAVVAAVRNSVVTITSQGVSARGLVDIPSTGVGSGIVLTANGYILTNKHVVTGSQTLSVELADGEQFDATVVTESPHATAHAPTANRAAIEGEGHGYWVRKTITVVR
jgi:putative serine protease PepD